ncbi:hypothetical protein VTJ04DRAFT_8414 [Mycothermus thermophilus]|uniref:uncharacterized protein n=1 Tax=Humicola insolens TaxID=85995 RepID=UPI0037433E39
MVNCRALAAEFTVRKLELARLAGCEVIELTAVRDHGATDADDNIKVIYTKICNLCDPLADIVNSRYRVSYIVHSRIMPIAVNHPNSILPNGLAESTFLKPPNIHRQYLLCTGVSQIKSRSLSKQTPYRERQDEKHRQFGKS